MIQKSKILIKKDKELSFNFLFYKLFYYHFKEFLRAQFFMGTDVLD